MKYMGSKNRIAKEILPIILKGRKENQYYVEPFCGGCNTIDKVTGNRIANDKNKYLIAMWKGLQEDSVRNYKIPYDTYSEARTEFNNATNLLYDDFLIGWIGFMASFNGRFFDGGYNGNYKKRNYTKESIDNIEKQVKDLLGVKFYCENYNELFIPDNSIIYCDIPYKNTKQYGTSKDFNHSDFWQWCRDMTVKGHKVFISEYEAPNDFKCIWSKDVKVAIRPDKTLNKTERLFSYCQ